MFFRGACEAREIGGKGLEWKIPRTLLQITIPGARSLIEKSRYVVKSKQFKYATSYIGFLMANAIRPSGVEV